MTTLTYQNLTKYKKSPIKDGVMTIKILSNANRYAIMNLLLNSRKDICVHELSEQLGISQSATSHILSYLEARGVVESVRMGKTKCYVPTHTELTKKIRGVIKSLV